LSGAEFQGLGDMPPELGWFANLDNPRTRRGYRLDVKEFTAFAGVERPEQLRQVTRAHRNRLALRPPLRGQRRQPQPGPRRQAPQSGGQRRQNGVSAESTESWPLLPFVALPTTAKVQAEGGPKDVDLH
jgi:hypothetical protein